MSGKKELVNYEFKTVIVEEKFRHIFSNYIPAFGYEVENVELNILGSGKLKFHLKRDSEIEHKEEVMNLEKQFFTTLQQLSKQEYDVEVKPSLIAYSTGLFGLFFMFGGIINSVYGNIGQAITLYVLTGICYIIPYWLYKSFKKENVKKFKPTIEKTNSRLYAYASAASKITK